MITVKEVFIKAYGPLPEDEVTCHIGYEVAYSGINTQPTVASKDGLSLYTWSKNWRGEGEWYLLESEDRCPFGPDLSDRAASAFDGFFVAPYDLELGVHY